MADCRLRQGTGGCTFQGTPGQVTLSVEGTTGTVLIQKAKYDGKDISGLPAKTMTFSLVAGRKELHVVYVFSDTTHGAGVLKEVCSSDNPLIAVSAKEPSAVYYVCA